MRGLLPVSDLESAYAIQRTGRPSIIVVVRAAEVSLPSTERAFIMTGGTWVYGNGSGLTEISPIEAPPIVAWRPAILDRTRRLAERGIRSVVIAPGMLYGHGGGLPAMLQRTGNAR